MIFDFIVKAWKKFVASDFIKKFLAGGITDDLKKYGTISVSALQKIRENIHSPGVKKVVDAIPGDWDLKIVDAIDVALGKIIPKIAQENECLSKGTQLEMLKCTMQTIDGKELTERTVFYTNLAFQLGVELIKTFVGKQFNLNALMMLIPALYTQLFGKKTADLKPLK